MKGNKKKRILIITNIPAPYRVDFFYYLQNTVDAYEFMVLYGNRNEDNRAWSTEQEKIKNSYFLNSKTIRIKKRYDIKYIHIPVHMEKTLNEIKPDLVIGSEYNPVILKTVSWCKKHRVNFISWTDGTLHSERNISLIQKIARKYVLSYADKYIASSTKAKEKLLYYGVGEEDIYISLLSVDIEKYKREKTHNNAFQMIYVGSLIERKGLDLLIEALAVVKKDFKLLVVGGGGEEKRLKELAEKRGIIHKIEFCGFLEGEELQEKYNESDFFILPTREDCFGLVILEAMCNSLPVICSKYADGCYDLLDETDGVIVDPYDTAKFAGKIEEFLGNGDRLLKMGARAYRRTEKFSFENIAKGFIDAISAERLL